MLLEIQPSKLFLSPLECMHGEGGPAADRRNTSRDPTRPKRFDHTKATPVNVRILCISFTSHPQKKMLTGSGPKRECLLHAGLGCAASLSLSKKKGKPGGAGGEQKPVSPSLGIMAHAGPGDTKLFVQVSSAHSSANSTFRQEEFENISAALWFLGAPL